MISPQVLVSGLRTKLTSLIGQERVELQPLSTQDPHQTTLNKHQVDIRYQNDTQQTQGRYQIPKGTSL